MTTGFSQMSITSVCMLLLSNNVDTVCPRRQFTLETDGGHREVLWQDYSIGQSVHFKQIRERALEWRGTARPSAGLLLSFFNVHSASSPMSVTIAGPRRQKGD